MLATGELQSLAPQLDFLELAELLRLKVAGEPFPHSFIHEVNAYSAAPEDLVHGRDPAGDGKGMAWYFCGAANCHQSAGGALRRNRQVGGGGGKRRFWHPEGGEKPIQGPDRKPVGAYWRTLSYVLKIKNPPGAKKSFRNKRLGWCMIEIGLQQQDGGAGQLVLCKVYRSPRADAEAIMPGGGMPCPAPCERDNQSMELAMEDGRPVIAKNLYIPQTAGTVIIETTSKSILTSIELKRNVTILDIERTSTLDQDTFVVKAISIFQNFEDLGMSVDWESTSEGKMSFTLVPSEMLNQESIQLVLDNTVEELQKIATVERLQDRSVISLTGNPQMSIVILGRALNILESSHVAVERVSPGSSKVTKVSFVVHENVAERCVQVLRSAFFEKDFVSEVEGLEKERPIPLDSSAASSSNAEAPPCGGQNWKDTDRIVLQEFDYMLLSADGMDLNEFFNTISAVPTGVQCSAWVECSSDLDVSGEVQSEEEQELTEAEESGSGLGSVTEELRKRSRAVIRKARTTFSHRHTAVRSSSTTMTARIWVGSLNPGSRWVHHLAIVKPSMPRAGHTYSLCSRLAACFFLYWFDMAYHTDRVVDC